jgi:sensor domain CHASE-containing protein
VRELPRPACRWYPAERTARKEVKLGDRRYIVCRNLVEAAQAARTREAVLATLRVKLRQGDKSLVGKVPIGVT